MTLSSCDKNDDDMCIGYPLNDNIEDAVDPLYPTIVYRLSVETLSHLRNDFAQRNPYIFSNLNQFGFCSLIEDSYGLPAPSGSFTEEEAIAAVKEFVVKNPEYTGVGNANDLHVRSIELDNSTEQWVIRIKNQTINNTEIYYTEIIFHTRKKAVVGCWGNHFPNVYVPENFNFDIERAKSKLLGKEVFHVGWSGEYSLGIIKVEHLKESSTNLIIVPQRSDWRIKLRVAWQIRIPQKAMIFYIDVMTGEIIGEEPTIIS